MPKGIKQAEDAQRNKAGWGCPKEMKWAKKAQNSMRINPAEILGNVNWIKEMYMVGPKEAQQVQVKW